MLNADNYGRLFLVILYLFGALNLTASLAARDQLDQPFCCYDELSKSAEKKISDLDFDQPAILPSCVKLELKALSFALGFSDLDITDVPHAFTLPCLQRGPPVA